MADWNDPTPEKNPLGRKPASAAGPGAGQSAGDSWRESKPRSNGGASNSVGSSAHWNATDEPTIGIAPAQITRWLIGLGLIAATLVLVFVFVKWAFLTPRRLPIYHVVMGDYGTAAIGQNPFASSERKIWGEASDGAIDHQILLRSTARDETGELANRLLADIGKNDDALTKLLASQRISHAGGGTDRDTRVWLISAVAAENQGELKLLIADPLQASAPVDSTQQLASEGVSLTRVLQQIGEATPMNQLGLVLLDLRAPPVVMDFQYSVANWQTLVDQARKGALPSTDRLVIAVAASDAEVNWTAHELGCGVFTHYAHQAIGGLADSNRDTKVTLGEFQDFITRGVQDWVARRRGATQSPSWFVPPSLQNSYRSKSLFSAIDPIARPVKSTSQTLVEHTDRLKGLWQKHAALAGFRSDPVRWGEIEANLVLLYEALERNSLTSFSTLASQIDAAFLRWDTRTDNAATSLHEPRWQPEAAQSNDLLEAWSLWYQQLAADSSPAGPTKPETDQSGAASTPPAELQPPPAISEPLLSWVGWANAIGRRVVPAEGLSTYTEVRRLGRDNLIAAVRFHETQGDGAGNRRSVEWQEYQLMRLMISEIDWDGVKQRDRLFETEELSLGLCRCFDLLMEISGRYGRDCYRWIDKDLKAQETIFANALDELFAGRTELIKPQIPRLISDLEKLLTRTRKLQHYLTIHTESQYELTHLYAWLLQGYLVADGGNELTEFTNRLTRWRRTLELTQQLTRIRETPTGQLTDDSEFLALGDKLDGELKVLRRDWNQFVDRLASEVQGEGSESNYRWLRIALKNPLVSYQSRIRMMDKWSDYLATTDDILLAGRDPSKANVAEAPHQSNRSIPAPARKLEDVYQLVWGDANSTDEASLVRQIFSGQTLDRQVIVTAFEPESSDGRLRWTYRSEAQVRHAALLLGHRFSSGDRERLRAEIQRAAIEQLAGYWSFQATRLASLGLGDGKSVTTYAAVPPYFRRAAEEYLRASERLSIRNNEGLKSVDDMIKGREAGIVQLQVQWGEDGSQRTFDKEMDKVSETVRITSPNSLSLPVVASIALRSDRRERTRIPFADVPFRAFELQGARGGQTEVTVDLAPFRNDQVRPIVGTVAFRGHHLITPLNWQEIGRDLKSFLVQFEPSPVGKTELIVDATPEPPTLNIMILIDCSGSMKRDVGGVSLMRKVKEEAVGVIDQLDRLNTEGTVRVNVGLSLLGVGGEEVDGRPWHRARIEDFRESERGRQLRMSAVDDEIVSTNLQPIRDVRWRDDLKDFVMSDKVEASGNTPLYLAIDRAFSALSRTAQDSIRHVVVVSDGVNYYPPKKSYNAADLSKSLKAQHQFGRFDSNKNGLERRLSIFMFDNKMIGNADVNAAYNQGMDDLKRTLKSDLGTQYRFFETTDFSQFRRELETLIPPTEVIVTKAALGSDVVASGSLGDSLPINLQSSKMMKVNAEVRGFLLSAMANEPIPVYDGQSVLLTLGGSHQERIQWKGWTPAGLGSRRWKESEVLFSLAEPRRDHSLQRLNFSVLMQPRQPVMFPERPVEVLARLERVNSSGRDVGAFNILDYGFEGTDWSSISRIRLAEVPWFETDFGTAGDIQSDSVPDVRVRLWVKGSAIEPAKKILEIRPGDEPKSDTLGDATVVVRHDGDRVVVAVKDRSTSKSNSTDNSPANTQLIGTERCFDWIVRSSLAGKTTRSYAIDGSQAEHIFEIPDRKVSGGPVKIELRSFRESIRQMDPIDFDLKAIQFR